MNNDHVLLAGKQLSKVFGFGKDQIQAVNKVDFNFRTGEIISIVGERAAAAKRLWLR